MADQTRELKGDPTHKEGSHVVIEVFEITVIELCEFREHHPHHHHCHKNKHLVEIKIDGKPVHVHIGKINVEALKMLGNVPRAFELDQLVGGTLLPLPDDGSVEIKGCEQFEGIPKTGQSS